MPFGLRFPRVEQGQQQQAADPNDFESIFHEELANEMADSEDDPKRYDQIMEIGAVLSARMKRRQQEMAAPKPAAPVDPKAEKRAKRRQRFRDIFDSGAGTEEVEAKQRYEREWQHRQEREQIGDEDADLERYSSLMSNVGSRADRQATARRTAYKNALDRYQALQTLGETTRHNQATEGIDSTKAGADVIRAGAERIRAQRDLANTNKPLGTDEIYAKWLSENPDKIPETFNTRFGKAPKSPLTYAQAGKEDAATSQEIEDIDAALASIEHSEKGFFGTGIGQSNVVYDIGREKYEADDADFPRIKGELKRRREAAVARQNVARAIIGPVQGEATPPEEVNYDQALADSEAASPDGSGATAPPPASPISARADEGGPQDKPIEDMTYQEILAAEYAVDDASVDAITRRALEIMRAQPRTTYRQAAARARQEQRPQYPTNQDAQRGFAGR